MTSVLINKLFSQSKNSPINTHVCYMYMLYYDSNPERLTLNFTE